MPIPILKKLGARLAKWIKGSSFPDLFRYMNRRKNEYDDAITRAKSLVALVKGKQKLISLSSSEDGIDVNVGKLRTSDRRAKIDTNDKQLTRTNKGVVLDLPTFKAPDRKQVAKHAKVVDELEGMIAEIDAVLNRMETFDDVRAKKERASLTDYRKHLAQSLDEVLDVLDDVVNNHVPEDFSKMMLTLKKHVNSILPEDSYDGLEVADTAITSHETFAGKKNAAIEFTSYLYVEGLDKELFNIDKFILVLTGVVHEVAIYRETTKLGTLKKDAQPVIESARDDSKTYKKTASSFRMAMYLTSINKFATPGHFDVGVELSGSTLAGLQRDMNKQATLLISAHSLSPVFNALPINITTQGLRHSPITNVNGVVDAVKEGNTVVVQLSVSNPKVIRDDIWPDMIVALNTVVSRRRKDANFVYALEKVSNKTYMRITYVKG